MKKTDTACRMARPCGVSFPNAVMKAMKKTAAQRSRKTAMPVMPPRQLKRIFFRFSSAHPTVSISMIFRTSEHAGQRRNRSGNRSCASLTKEYAMIAQNTKRYAHASVGTACTCNAEIQNRMYRIMAKDMMILERRDSTPVNGGQPEPGIIVFYHREMMRALVAGESKAIFKNPRYGFPSPDNKTA